MNQEDTLILGRLTDQYKIRTTITTEIIKHHSFTVTYEDMCIMFDIDYDPSIKWNFNYDSGSYHKGEDPFCYFWATLNGNKIFDQSWHGSIYDHGDITDDFDKIFIEALPRLNITLPWQDLHVFAHHDKYGDPYTFGVWWEVTEKSTEVQGE